MNIFPGVVMSTGSGGTAVLNPSLPLATQPRLAYVFDPAKAYAASPAGNAHTMPNGGELVSGTGSTSPSTTTFAVGGAGLIWNPSVAGAAFGTIWLSWHATTPVATDPPTGGYALQPGTAIQWEVDGASVKVAGIVIGGGTTNYYAWSV